MLPIEQFHPVSVHFPLVFLLSLALFDAVAVLRGYAVGGRGAAANLSAGLATLAGLAAIVAYIFGDIAFDIAREAGAPMAPLHFHHELGEYTTIALAIWGALRGGLWWYRVPLAGWRSAATVMIELALAVLIVVTAYYGGILVYDLGIGVTHGAG